MLIIIKLHLGGVLIDIRQLRYFIAITETNNFTLASKNLFITQPTLSHQIAELERQIGVKLLVRNRHSVQLTHAGAALLKEAKEIVTKADEAVKITRQAEAGTIGNIKIGFLGASERRFLPQLIANFRKRYPKISISLNHFDSFTTLDRNTLDGAIDLAITLKSTAESLTTMNWKVVYTVPLSLVFSDNHPLADQIPNNLAVLDHEAFFYVTQDRGLAHTLEVCTRRNIHPTINLVPHIQSVLMSVEAGEGFSILPRSVPETYASPLLRYINIEDDDSFLDVIVAWNNNNTNPSVPLFLTELDNILPL
ncbi:MAG: transcriptional regulator, LysR family [Firmicutes bacterium]|nr:transcriptional regulator, LysR family [Bacillota bacterium]